MEFQKPIYNPGDIVYLKESAAIGFLEAYKVVHAKFNADGTVAYVLDTSVKSPTVATFGDMVGPPRYSALTINESDLVDYCGGLDLAIAVHERQLASLQAKRASICVDN